MSRKRQLIGGDDYCGGFFHKISIMNLCMDFHQRFARGEYFRLVTLRHRLEFQSYLPYLLNKLPFPLNIHKREIQNFIQGRDTRIGQAFQFQLWFDPGFQIRIKVYIWNIFNFYECLSIHFTSYKEQKAYQQSRERIKTIHSRETSFDYTITTYPTGIVGVEYWNLH